jgi:hypothetical protein
MRLLMFGTVMLMANGAGAQNSVKPFHLDEATISDVHAAYIARQSQIPGQRRHILRPHSTLSGRASSLPETYGPAWMAKNLRHFSTKRPGSWPPLAGAPAWPESLDSSFPEFSDGFFGGRYIC